jgi:uncharacterized protein (TIGR02598 family)
VKKWELFRFPTDIDNLIAISVLHGMVVAQMKMPVKATFGGGPRAFSLVEVVLALGVVSFALVSLMALLPISLATFRDNKKDTVHADILRQLTSDATLTSYANADKLAQQTFWYDDEGVPLPSNATGVVYTAVLSVSPLGGPWNTTQSSALPGGVSTSTNLRRLQVNITDVNQPKNPTIYNIVLYNEGNAQ